MAYDENPDRIHHTVLEHRQLHYYGGVVRALFIVAALVLLIAKTVGAELPLSLTGSVVTAVLLIVAAGITTPVLVWIQWINEVFALWGTLLFGTSAIEHYRAGSTIADTSFFAVEVLAILFLIALYYATKTVRGILLRAKIR